MILVAVCVPAISVEREKLNFGSRLFAIRAHDAAHSSGAGARLRTRAVDAMKRIAAWAFYAIGILAILYLALYAYVTFTGNEFRPGDPIHIFRKPDAPNYS